MEIYWLEQTDADVPAENDWLSANEAVRLNTMRFARRRNDSETRTLDGQECAGIVLFILKGPC